MKTFTVIFLLLLLLPIHIFPQSNAAVLYEQGRYNMSRENWYSALESLLEAVRLSPSHAQATAAIAECYYELSEFDEALIWARKARLLARADMSVANLEVFILIALGQLDTAQACISDILVREPYNRETLFAAGELDIARGRPSEALLRYRDAVRRYPDDRRLLVSLALVSASLGDSETSLVYINRAMEQHPDDYRIFYFAAYIYAQNNRISNAITYANRALNINPTHQNSRTLLANLRYRNNQFEEAANLADTAISADRLNMDAWYLKGLSYIRLGRYSDAVSILSNALAVNPEDEFIRAILEDALMASTTLEDPARSRWAAWHFTLAAELRQRNLTEQALFEYRRGLRLYPYAIERRNYAELLRLTGFPSRYLEELLFLQEQGKADRPINDAVEAYSSLLSDALFKQWQVNPVDVTARYWNVAVFSTAGQSGGKHADAGAVCAAMIKDILVHERNIIPANLDIRQPSFSRAFSVSREKGLDYFIIISVNENERDISVKAEMFIARTGTSIGIFTSYRTGVDRLRSASRLITRQISQALPLRGTLLMRKQNLGLINKGKADGVTAQAVYDIIKKGRLQIANDSIALVYTADEMVGKITIDNVDEEIASGTLTRNGFFDRIEPGDEFYFKKETETGRETNRDANPELRALLRMLRN